MTNAVLLALKGEATMPRRMRAWIKAYLLTIAGIFTGKVLAMLKLNQATKLSPIA
jgi:hypothetical protein